LVCKIDASKAIEKLRRSIDLARTSLTASDIKKLCGGLKRSASRNIREDFTIEFDERTIRAASELLIQLTRTAKSSFSQTRTGILGKALKSLVSSCIETIALLCEKAECKSSWKYCMDYVSAAAEIIDVGSNELLPGPASTPRLLSIRHGISSGLKAALSVNDISGATSLYSSVRAHSLLRQAVADDLNNLLRNESARLPFSSQEWIMGAVGAGVKARELTYANPADAPEIRQAAGLLLFLSDSSVGSPLILEAFERFRALCEKHFHLYVRGGAGEVMGYDSRLHELSGPESGQVRVTRPWVEFLDPPHSAIVIRAMATPA
jgi:hypothetical protein